MPKEAILRISRFLNIELVPVPYDGLAGITEQDCYWTSFKTVKTIFGNLIRLLIIFRKLLGVKSIGES